MRRDPEDKYANAVAYRREMTIKVTRYRAWPTTMKNKAGATGTGKGIPATVRSTVITLQ